MAIQQPKQKSFFAKYWWAFAGGAALIFIALAAAAVLVYLFVLKGDAKVTDLRLSADKVEYGKKIEAVVTVKNDRVLDAKFIGKITVDGVEKDLDEADVPSGETVEVDYNLHSLKPGLHTVVIGELKKELKILKPAEFSVSGLALDPAESVLVGGTVTASAKIKNAGEVKGTYMAIFACDGIKLDPISVTVGPLGEEPVSVSIPISVNGTHEISLESMKQSFTALNPANVAGTALTLSKAYAKPNEAVTATVRLENTGDIAGTYTLELLINGKSASKQEVTVEANSHATYDFKVTQSKAGTYVLKAGKLSQTLYVVTITRPKNGTLLVKKNNSSYRRLTLINGYKNQDAVFILTSTTNPKVPLLTVYVRAGSTAANIRVKNGTYIVYYMIGTNYDSASKRFITNPILVRFDGTFKFTTTGGYYTTWKLTINASNGNEKPIAVDDADFPK